MRLIAAILFALLALPAYAAQTCTVTATWTDSTPTGAGYAPTYKAWVRKNGGTATLATSATPSVTFTAFACVDNDLIEVQAQNRNTLGGGIDGPLSSWVGASVPATPNAILSINIGITVNP